MSAKMRKSLLCALVLAGALAVTQEASAKAPIFYPGSGGPANGIWSPGPNQLNWRLGQYGAQYNRDNNGGRFTQAYGPNGTRAVYEQNQFFRGQRTTGSNGVSKGWVESPFLPGVRLSW